MQPSLLSCGYKSPCNAFPPARFVYRRKIASLIWVDLTASSGPAWIGIAVMSGYKARKSLQVWISYGLPWPAACLFFFFLLLSEERRETKPIAIPHLSLFPILKFSSYHSHTSWPFALYFPLRNCHYFVGLHFAYLLHGLDLFSIFSRRI